MKTKADDLLDYNGELTKREYFAALAMQAIAKNWNDINNIAEKSVQLADALIKELNKVREK